MDKQKDHFWPILHQLTNKLFTFIVLKHVTYRQLYARMDKRMRKLNQWAWFHKSINEKWESNNSMVCQLSLLINRKTNLSIISKTAFTISLLSWCQRKSYQICWGYVKQSIDTWHWYQNDCQLSTITKNKL